MPLSQRLGVLALFSVGLVYASPSCSPVPLPQNTDARVGLSSPQSFARLSSHKCLALTKAGSRPRPVSGGNHMPDCLSSQSQPQLTLVCSQLECNLLVICGTIPTLRKFFGHISPRFFGSSAATSKASGGATPNLPTSNRRPAHNRRNPYAKFGAKDTDFELSRWDGVDDSKDSPTVVVSGDPPHQSEDDNSERAIIVTQEVSVMLH
jgi:hypothetical protein